jgi:hypothetical protein
LICRLFVMSIDTAATGSFTRSNGQPHIVHDPGSMVDTELAEIVITLCHFV